MKKLKKRDFKKLALMGIAGGTMLASQAPAHLLADGNSYANLLAANCNSNAGGGCHAQAGSGGYTSYNPRPSSCAARMPAQTAYNAHPSSCAAGAPPPKYYYTDNDGKWREGRPPDDYTNPQARPNQPYSQSQPQAYNYSDTQSQPGRESYSDTWQGSSNIQNPNGSNPNQTRPDQSSQYYQNPQAMPKSQGYMADSTYNTKTDSKLTQDTLPSQLNAEGRSTFEKLSPEGKVLALQLANQSCKGQNDCKGRNSCKTDKNTCAGFGSCKGTSKGPFEDKNLAVKVAAKIMADKRAKAANYSR